MISFGVPRALFALGVLPLFLALALYARRRREARLSRFLGPQRDRMTHGGGGGLRRAGLRVLGLGFLVLAVADPRWGYKVEEYTQRGVDVMFVLDVSRSMQAADVRPSRLMKARAEIRNLLGYLAGDRVGLMVFAGLPDVLCPLTSDRGAFRLFLDMADTDLIPVPGTDLGKAIEAAAQVLGEDETKYKVVVLLTDGEDHEARGLAAAAAAAKRGIRVHTVNVGGAGAPLMGEGGYRTDEDGKAIFSRPDPEGLAAIASATGGGFYQASSPRLELGALGEEIADMEDRDLHGREVRDMEERYQFPLAVALLIFGLEVLLEPTRPDGGRRLA